MEMVGTSVGGGRTYIRHFVRTLPEVDKTNEWFIFVHPKVKEEEKWNLPPRIMILTSHFAVKSIFHRLIWQHLYLPLFIILNRIDVLFSAGHFGTLYAPCRQVVLLRNSSSFGPRYLMRLLKWTPIKDNLELFFHRLLTLLNIRLADVILTPTKTMRDIVGAYYRIPRKKWAYAYYGYASEPACDDKSLPIRKQPGEKWLVYPTLLTLYKNFDTVFRAIEKVINQHAIQHLRLVIFVDFERDEYIHNHELSHLHKKLISLASCLGLQESILPLGMCPRSTLIRVLALSDVIIWASILESFGYPMVEALAQERNIVAADTPVNREILGDTASYFKPLDPTDCADKIIEALTSTTQRQDSNTLISRFTWQEHLRRVMEVVKGK